MAPDRILTRPIMDRYHSALFFHLVALIVAAGATAITKLAAGRRARARTVGEMREWHDVLTSAARGPDQPAPVLVPPTLVASIGVALAVVAGGVVLAAASVLLRPARTPAAAFTAWTAG